MPKRIIGYQISFVAEICFTAAYTAIGAKMERPRNNLKSKRVERKNGNSKISLNILIKIIKLIFFHLFLKDLKKTKELM